MMKRLKPILMLALPYVVTALLPIVSTFYLSGMLITSYYGRVIENRQKSITSACDRFYQRMNNMVELACLIAENDAVIRYIYDSIGDKEHSVIDNMEMSELLASFWANGDVEAIYLCDLKGNRIITPNSVCSNVVDYFKLAYKMEGYTAHESVERLKASTKSNQYSTAIKVEMGQKITEVVEYRLLLPLGRGVDNQFQLVFVMETQDILDDLYDVLGEEDEIYIYDSTGELIYSNGDRYEPLLDIATISDLQLLENEAQELYGLVSHADNKSLKLKIYVSDMMYNGDVENTYIWVLMGSSLLASILFCIYFTFRNHREILEILEMFGNQKRSDNKESRYQDIHCYKAIKEYTKELVAENSMIKESIPRLENACKYEILDKLIRNTYQNKEEIETVLCNEKIGFFTGTCVVFCIRYKGASYRSFVYEDITVKDYMKRLLSEIIERKFVIFDTSSRETILILSMQADVLKIIAEDLISTLNVEVAYRYGIEVEIGVGNIVDSIYQISESYQQAKAVLRYRECSGKNIHLYGDLERLEDIYYFPKEYDGKIYNYVVAGKKAEAKEIIQKIYRENFEENDKILTVNVVEAIKSRLKDSLILVVGKCDIANDLSIKDKLARLNCEQSAMSFFQLVYETVDMISESVENKKKNFKQHTTLKIMQYINDNYCDNMLSLKTISLALGLHENYISNVFSAEYGEPISVVIESRRIEKACNLIKNTDMKISDIAQSVGYSSDISFRRAFKKIKGVSPKEYRGDTGGWKDE